ncbi:hypothetical protein ACFIOY_11040 [Bradyrhizobium sp. TZ2]
MHWQEGSIAEQRNGNENATSSKILVRTYSTTLKCWRSSQYDHRDSKAANRLVDDRNVGRFFLGATMRIDLFHLRNLKIVTGLAFCLATLPVPSHAFTQDDQRRLCTGDVFRLCASEIPDRARITACMRRQRASLSPGCRSVFGKPSDQSASAKQSDY